MYKTVNDQEDRFKMAVLSFYRLLIEQVEFFGSSGHWERNMIPLESPTT